MSHIFISYSKKDTRKLAFDLADALNAISGITAWVDRSLRAGPSWEAQIEKEILRCDYFVVLYSPDINRHLHGDDESYVLTEISYAKRTAKKRIIPVMAQATTAPISLTLEHYIDYTYPDLTVADLVEAICAEIGVESVGTRNGASSGSAPTLGAKSAKLLPAPFAWISIPAGKVTLVNDWDDDKQHVFLKKGQSKTVEVPAFAIGKYPVTNAQFRLFVDAGGYKNRQSWTDEGWAEREKDKLAKPLYWNKSQRNGVNHPVVGVS